MGKATHRYTKAVNAFAAIASPITQFRWAGVGLLALCTLGLAHAQAPAFQASAGMDTVPAGHERGQLAERFVNDRLAVWRQRLKLEDWQISVVMIRRGELKSKTLGGIRWDKDKKCAVISVLDASDYRLAFREMLDDMEFTIVHELVHLELASLPRSEASRGREEHAVNRLAEALLKLDRQK